MTTTYHVAMGDMHCSLRNGLIAPGTELTYDNGEKRLVLLSDWSKWLWGDVWQPGIEYGASLVGKNPLYIHCTGDSVHGAQFSEFLYSNYIDHQVQIAVGALAAWRQVPTLAGLAHSHGTQPHDYGENAASKLIAADVAAWGLEVEAGEHLFSDFGGVFIDQAHRGPSTGDGENYGNVARRYAQRYIRRQKERDETVPVAILRGHIHVDFCERVSIVWAGTQHVETLMIITPPMCGPNGYSRQASLNAEWVRCGMYFFVVEDGIIKDVWPWLVERDTRQYYEFANVGVVAHTYKGTPRKGKKKKGELHPDCLGS
jgi:hypothetical protein